MNAERLGIARRFAACPKWEWFAGMVALRLDGDEVVSSIRIDVLDDVVSMAFHGTSTDGHAVRFPVRGRVPDLDDDLTSLGVLAVVRRAWNDPTASVRFVDRTPLESVWECRGRWVCYGATEELALLAALESAPK